MSDVHADDNSTVYAGWEDAYEEALRIISQWGDRISSAECADIAHKGLIGDVSWLLAWTEPEL